MTRGNMFPDDSDSVSLREAIEMGEYDPKYLSTFAEWQKLSRNMQWQMVRKALKNRRRLLWTNYAEIFNQIDFSEKPELKIAMENVQKQTEKLQKEEEKLQLEYSLI